MESRFNVRLQQLEAGLQVQASFEGPVAVCVVEVRHT
jgi:hypothetical protein